MPRARALVSADGLPGLFSVLVAALMAGISGRVAALARLMDNSRNDPRFSGVAATLASAAETLSPEVRQQIAASKTAADNYTNFCEGDPLPDDQVPDWVRLGSLETIVAWILGEARTCKHNPNPRSPGGPIFAAAWEKDLVVCERCTGRIQVRNAKANNRCDGCGKVFPQGIRPAAIQNGNLFWHFGICDECGKWLDADDEPPHLVVPPGVKCDFCFIADIAEYKVPANEFTVIERFGGGEITWNSMGAWRACEKCVAFIREGKWWALVIRLTTLQQARYGKSIPMMRVWFQDTFDLLAQNITGPPEKLTDNEKELSR